MNFGFDGIFQVWMRKNDFEADEMDLRPSDYARRIFIYSNASPSCFVLALLYLERIELRNPHIRLNARTMQRLFLVAVMVASKYLDDDPLGNISWFEILSCIFTPPNAALTWICPCRARIGDIPIAELNHLELKFLEAIDFNLYTTSVQYDQCVSRLYGWANKEQEQPHLPKKPENTVAAETSLTTNSAETVALRRQGGSCRRLPYPEKDT
jgi:hypothetical protein